MKRAQAPIDVGTARGRAMLQWTHKAPLESLAAPPAQHVETFDPAGRTSHASPTEHGGLLFQGDSKEVLAHLLASGFRGKVRLVYIDPPFDSGADYVRRVTLRGARAQAPIEGSLPSLGEQLQYSDLWGRDRYLQFMYERLLLLKELLADDGSIFLHCDWHQGHHLRCLMDEVFGAGAFRNAIVWHYYNKLASASSRFSRAHDDLLFYANEQAAFTPLEEPREQPVRQIARRYKNGVAVNVKGPDGKVIYRERTARRIDDVWRIPCLQPADQKENTQFQTQKPEALLERILGAASRPGDLVLDCFCGSGTTAVVAQRMGRRWIACDLNRTAVQLTAARLRPLILAQHGAAAADPPPAQLAFDVWRVNDYELDLTHADAVRLACEHVGVAPDRSDPYFDGTLGGALAKVIPFDRPLSADDLAALECELTQRPDEGRPIALVCLGLELRARAWLEDWNRLRGSGAANRIDVIELRTDPRHGRLFAHAPARARVSVVRRDDSVEVAIEDFLSPTILERCRLEDGRLAEIDDWRAMVDCVLIDPDHDGRVFRTRLADTPARRSELVRGRYTVPAARDRRSRVAVRILDLLGEEVLSVHEIE